MGSGFRWDLEEVCKIAKNRGARMVIDAAQSAGTVPIDVSAWNVDILAAPCFKWMLGPLGAGFMYICPELIAACDPPLPGWFGVTNPGENDLRLPCWHETAHKFERGVPSMMAIVGAAAGLKLLKALRHEAVFNRIATLTRYLYEALSELGVTIATPRDAVERAGIVAIRLPGQDRLWQRLKESKIHVGNWLGCLRIDPACYNTEAELDTLLAHIRGFLGA
jgi:selenocysteine lyase/cysteine desulfurase